MQVLMAILATALSAVLLLFFDPILSVHILDLGVHEANIALAFALSGLTYTIGSIAFGYIAEKWN